MKRFLSTIVAAMMILSVSGCSDVIDELETLYEEFEDSDDKDDRDDEQSVTENDPQSGTAPMVTNKENFENGGTSMSLVNGDLEISRLSRENERPMGGDDWTILVYMCGTDLETEANAAMLDIVEMIESDHLDSVNIVLQTGGAKEWYNDAVDADKLQRYENVKGDFELVEELKLDNMGESETLSDFITWGAENYPADNMGLILWNHGSGSINGVCFDENYKMDSLTLNELDRALLDSYESMTERFEFIGFDACLMATLETANILTPYAKYMYASQETEPGSGWDYTTIVNYLVDEPDADGAELGKVICDSFYKACESYYSEDKATLSVIDLSKMDALLKSFDATAQQMYQSGSYTDIVKGIKSAEYFGSNNRTEGYANMVDLGGALDAASYYCSNAADTMARLDDAVIYSVNGWRHSYASGLSVYYPLAVQGSEELSIFAGVCPSTYYLAFVDKTAYGTTGSDISDYDAGSLLDDHDDIWDIGYVAEDYCVNTDTFTSASAESTISVEDVYFDDDGIYTVQLSSYDALDYAACSLFLTDSDGTSIYLGSDDEVLYSDTGFIIQDNFNGSWISLDDGQPLPIEVISQTANTSVYTCSILLNNEYTNLRIEYDWNAQKWNVIGAWDGIDPETGMAARDIIKIEKGDVITPVYYYVYGDSTDYFCGYDYVVGDKVALEYSSLPEGDYIYSIALYDIYGNWYFTPEVTFTIDDKGELYFYPDELGGGGIFDFSSDNSFDYDDYWY